MYNPIHHSDGEHQNHRLYTFIIWTRFLSILLTEKGLFWSWKHVISWPYFFINILDVEFKVTSVIRVFHIDMNKPCYTVNQNSSKGFLYLNWAIDREPFALSHFVKQRFLLLNRTWSHIRRTLWRLFTQMTRCGSTLWCLDYPSSLFYPIFDADLTYQKSKCPQMIYKLEKSSYDTSKAMFDPITSMLV